MTQIPTVKIVSDDTELGYVIINEADFNEDEHELFVAGSDNFSPPQDGPSADPPAGGKDEDSPTKAELMKLTKSELLAKAAEAGINVPVPDETTKEKIADLILAD